MLSAVFSKGGQKILALARKRKRNIGGKVKRKRVIE